MTRSLDLLVSCSLRAFPRDVLVGGNEEDAALMLCVLHILHLYHLGRVVVNLDHIS